MYIWVVMTCLKKLIVIYFFISHLPLGYIRTFISGNNFTPLICGLHHYGSLKSVCIIVTIMCLLLWQEDQLQVREAIIPKLQHVADAQDTEIMPL